MLKEALREVEREQQRVGFAERPTDMEYLKNTCAARRLVFPALPVARVCYTAGCYSQMHILLVTTLSLA